MSTLDAMDRFTLYSKGFTDKEITELDNAVDRKGNPQPPIDLNSPAWQIALKNRDKFTSELRITYNKTHKIPLSRTHHDRIVNAWYVKGGKKSPWDWLKEPYPEAMKKKTDFVTAMKARIRKTQQDLLRNTRMAK